MPAPGALAQPAQGLHETAPRGAGVASFCQIQRFVSVFKPLTVSPVSFLVLACSHVPLAGFVAVSMRRRQRQLCSLDTAGRWDSIPVAFGLVHKPLAQHLAQAAGS